MNSAINEFIPARVRGLVDLAINGSYWMGRLMGIQGGLEFPLTGLAATGAAIGASASLIFLDDKIIPTNLGWRLPFGIGALICSFIIVSRLFLPESPRY